MTRKQLSNVSNKKYLRVTFSRNVQQQASTDIFLSEEDYSKLKNCSADF